VKLLQWELVTASNRRDVRFRTISTIRVCNFSSGTSSRSKRFQAARAPYLRTNTFAADELYRDSSPDEARDASISFDEEASDRSNPTAR